MDRFLELFRKHGMSPRLDIHEDPDTGQIFVNLLDDTDDLSEFDLYQGRRDPVAPIPEPVIDARWYTPGERVTIHNITIDSGYIYVGKDLRSSRFSDNEPSLIDPSLDVSKRSSKQPLPHWSPYLLTYRSLTPIQRSTYLTWLAGGRQDRDIESGYLTLFLYGLELRVLASVGNPEPDTDELLGIRAELVRLLDIYGDYASGLPYYAPSLMNFIDLTMDQPGPFVAPAPPLLPEHPAWNVPAMLPATLGRFVANTHPIPAEWALAWTWYSPNIRLRTPAIRCIDEFSTLFRLRYREKFGDGIKIRPGKTRLHARYTPANNTIGSHLNQTTDIPDVFARRGPVKKLAILAEDVQIELESYSRWRANPGNSRDSLAALGYLPPELVDSQSPAVREFTDWATSRLTGPEPTLIAGSELVARWRGDHLGTLTPTQTKAYLRITEDLGFGIEPDIRFGERKLTPNMQVAMFRIDADTPHIGDDASPRTRTLVHLAAAVASADGPLSEFAIRRLLATLGKASKRSPAEHARLSACLIWLSSAKITMSGMKSRIDALNEADRTHIGDTLIAIATADGTVSPAEVSMLTKAFRMLYLDPKTVTSRIHTALTGGTTGAASTRGTLDDSTIRRIQMESHSVETLLGDIFTDHDEPLEATPSESMEPDIPTIDGLDAPHMRLLHRLGERDTWPRAEYDDLAAACGVMPGGAIDVINDVAYDIVGDPVIEGDDILTVRRDLFQDLYS